MIVRSFLLSLFFFSPLSGEVKLSPEQPSPEKMASGLGVKLPPRPWHLADVWWKFEKPVENFESLDVEVSIDRDVPDTYNLYVAPVTRVPFAAFAGLSSGARALTSSP